MHGPSIPFRRLLPALWALSLPCTSYAQKTDAPAAPPSPDTPRTEQTKPVADSVGAKEAPAPAAASSTEQKGAEHWAELLRQPWLAGWKGATLHPPVLVHQKTNPTFPHRLPPVWHGKITGPDGATGYVFWEAAGAGGLVEFCFDADLRVNGPDAQVVTDIPPLQQFPLPHTDGTLIASGCVPTAGASVYAYWAGKERPTTGSPNQPENLRETALKLRRRLKMQAFPDTDGFTENGMSLAGAQPRELADAMEAEAQEQKLPLTAAFHSFRFPLLKAEIAAGRPVLLSCTVRVPQKPTLSWGHEVVGVGCAEVCSAEFAGVLDNFYPLKNATAVRWIRQDAFHSLITFQPVK